MKNCSTDFEQAQCQHDLTRAVMHTPTRSGQWAVSDTGLGLHPIDGVVQDRFICFSPVV